MDNTAPEIVFDTNGICSFCCEFEKYAATTIWRPLEIRLLELNQAVEKIKKLGEGKRYDCILGLSGGVDSSYLCHWANETGLRPLVVHFDNGWNSELATKNIEQLIAKTGFELYTYVVDWEDFKDLQLAYIKASVLDIEVPTDQLIYATLHKIARKYRIKSIVHGNNISSEGILPSSWYHGDKMDIINLTNIHRKFGTRTVKSFPKLSMIDRMINEKLFSMFSVAPLNLLDYDKNKAKDLLIEKYGWRDYGGKHYESIFTRFYQGYILPRKFNVDKRKAHFSSLIMSGSMDRKTALEELQNATYEPLLMKQDYEYTLKKFGIGAEEFEKYMNQAPVKHEIYGTQWDKKHFRKYFIFRKICGPILDFLSRFIK